MLETAPWRAESQREKGRLGCLWSRVSPNRTEPLGAFVQKGLCGLSDAPGRGQGQHEGWGWGAWKQCMTDVHPGMTTLIQIFPVCPHFINEENGGSEKRNFSCRVPRFHSGPGSTQTCISYSPLRGSLTSRFLLPEPEPCPLLFQSARFDTAEQGGCPFLLQEASQKLAFCKGSSYAALGR